MVDQQKLSSRLSALESYLTKLSSFRGYSREQFVEELSERLKRWMGFRNILVHLYLEIDHGRVYDAIQEDLGDLENFAVLMARLL